MGLLNNKIVQVVIAIALPFIGAWVIGHTAQQNMFPWYDTINKPPWTPPVWLVGPVWLALYAAMGYASYRVYSVGTGLNPLLLYTVQLILNWTWPWALNFYTLRRVDENFLLRFRQVMFTLHLICFAAIHMTILLIFVLLTAASFWKTDELAGVLMFPYVGWIIYATAVAIETWRLNSFN